ncbi:type ISP restriction/modification enzyme, partial [Treponema sp. R6D11]
EQCKEYHNAKEKNKNIKLEEFVNYDSTKITWNRGFKQDLEKGIKFKYNDENIYQGIYRPFCKQYVYFAKELNDMTYQMTKIFPSNEHQNIIICIPGIGSVKDFSVHITDCVRDIDTYGGIQ